MRIVLGLIENNGKVYMQRRAPNLTYAGQWEFPGGKQEPGETDEETVVRELIEELEIPKSTRGYLGSDPPAHRVWSHGKAGEIYLPEIGNVALYRVHVAADLTLIKPRVEIADAFLWITSKEALQIGLGGSGGPVYPCVPSHLPLLKLLTRF